MLKNKQILLLALTILALAITAVIFWQSKNQPNSSPTDATTINMTAEGFSQTEITISKGDTIEWVNDDQDFRWPASNVHPAHTLYPEFDPKEPIAPGQSWSFTFEKAGEWKFHDHLKPYFVGTVTVVE